MEIAPSLATGSLMSSQADRTWQAQAQQIANLPDSHLQDALRTARKQLAHASFLELLTHSAASNRSALSSAAISFIFALLPKETKIEAQNLIQCVVDHATMDDLKGILGLCSHYPNWLPEHSHFPSGIQMFSWFCEKLTTPQWNHIKNPFKTELAPYLCAVKTEIGRGRLDDIVTEMLQKETVECDFYCLIEHLGERSPTLARDYWSKFCPKALEAMGPEALFLISEKFRNAVIIQPWQKEMFVRLLSRHQKEQILKDDRWLNAFYGSTRWIYLKDFDEPTFPLVKDKLDARDNVLDSFIEAAIRTPNQKEFWTYWKERISMKSISYMLSFLQQPQLIKNLQFTNEDVLQLLKKIRKLVDRKNRVIQATYEICNEVQQRLEGS